MDAAILHISLCVLSGSSIVVSKLAKITCPLVKLVKTPFVENKVPDCLKIPL